MRFAAITGTSRGLGQALANKFRDSGWEVLGLNRPAFDLLRWEEIDERIFGPASIARIERAVLINNAQSMTVRAISELPVRDLARDLTANIVGQIVLSKAFAATFPDGRIINVSSGAAQRPIAGWAAYCTAKAAVKMYFDVMKLEGHDVMSIDPGLIDTSMQAHIRASDFPDRHKFVAAERNGKLMSPLDVADLIYQAARIDERVVSRRRK